MFKLTILMLAFCLGQISMQDNPAFLKLGYLRGFNALGSPYEKTFYVPRHFRLRWSEARTMCRNFGYEIVSLENPSEAHAVQKMCRENENIFDWDTHIGGYNINPGSKDSWYWISSGSKIDYTINWATDEPNNCCGGEYLMGLKKPDFLFNDMHNNHEATFICELKKDLKIDDMSNKTVLCQNCVIG